MKKVLYMAICMFSLNMVAQISTKLKPIGPEDDLELYYRDADGDSYGNPNISIYRKNPIPGYVLNALDCDDTDPNININVVWYLDSDGDGLGDVNAPLISCTQPTGYVNNASDNCPAVFGINNGCPAATLTSHNFGNYNYIYEETLQVASTETTYNTIADQQKIRNIAFFDGMGRQVQSRAIGKSPFGKDIVTHTTYDNLGRQARAYLPYASTQSNGLYETGGDSKTVAQYNTAKYGNTTNPYSEKLFDNSPLNRVLETGAPGAPWLADPNSDTDHTVKMNYAVNTGTQTVDKIQ